MVYEVQSDYPLAPVAHRTGITSADGTTKPSPDGFTYAVNPGGRHICRLFVTTTGGPTTCTIRPYMRCGGKVAFPAAQVATGALLTLAGTPNFDGYVDVPVAGDDIIVFVESLSGGTSPAVNIYLSWR